MKIILKKEVANLGDAWDVVEVKAGYAQNYLIPQGMAVKATESALKQLEETLRQRAHKEAKLVADAEALSAKISAVAVALTAKVGENGKFYGSISAAQIAEALGQNGFDVDKKHVSISDIKTPGEYEAKVKCYKGVFATVKVTVTAE